MKDFENPFANTQLRAKPWFQLRPEETSYIIYNAYRMHFLKSEDVNDFVRLHRIQQATYWAFPLVASLPISYFLQRSLFNSPRFTTRIFNANFLTLIGISWFAFSKLSPFKKSYDEEKDRLLNYLDANMGLAMLHFNNMLPRHWTQNWVNGYTVKLYKQRHSRFTGILYPPEGATNTVRDSEEFPEMTEAGY